MKWGFVTKYYKDKDGDIWIWYTDTNKYILYDRITRKCIGPSPGPYSDDFYDEWPGRQFGSKEISKEEAFLGML